MIEYPEIDKRPNTPKYNPPPMPETAPCAPEIKYVISDNLCQTCLNCPICRFGSNYVYRLQQTFNKTVEDLEPGPFRFIFQCDRYAKKPAEAIDFDFF